MQGRSLTDWFRQRRRDLPWRREPRNPYHVVVSEFMLQQTQVDRVVPRFESFVVRFPDFESLAGASQEDVLDEWSGLGYYRRARLLHRLAQEVVGRPEGLPQTTDELSGLPGIGPYTSAAVASLAFGEVVPVLDGNVMRVGARAMAMDEDPRSAGGRRRLEAWIRRLMDGQSAAIINEALMELGATVCTPSDPDCGQCPFETECVASTTGKPERYPPPRGRRSTESLRWVAACVVATDGSWLLRRIDDGPILRGLWLPPLATVEEGSDSRSEAEKLVPLAVKSDVVVGLPVRHNITHRKIDVVPVRFETTNAGPPSEEWRWIDPDDPGVPTSSLLQKLVDALAN